MRFPVRSLFSPFLLSVTLMSGQQTQVERKPTYRPLREIKATWITNFLKFVRWPNVREKQDEIVLVLLGNDDFGDLVNYYETHKVKGKSLKVIRFAEFRGQAELRTCHMLYISKSEQDRIAEIMAFLGDVPVFSISEVDSFLKQGGIVQFKVVGDRFLYEVNQRLATKRELYISSQILGRAQRVERP